MVITRMFRTPALSGQAGSLGAELSAILGGRKVTIGTEWCFYVESTRALTQAEMFRLTWLLAETFESKNFGRASFLKEKTVLEIGPRPNFETAWSTTAVEICKRCGIEGVTRLERSVRYGLNVKLTKTQREAFIALVCDRMTEMPYVKPLKSFASSSRPLPWRTIQILGARDPLAALDIYSRKHGLGFDEQDRGFIINLFTSLGRDPTEVEAGQLAQANSEHSRHGVFKGWIVINGVEQPRSLMDLVKAPLALNPGNSVVAFCDDSSAIRGPAVNVYQSASAEASTGGPCRLVSARRIMCYTFTAETHNHPTLIAPYPGAATGIGGNLRDVFAIGRGGLCGANTAGYSVGSLFIPGYALPWEQRGFVLPTHVANPLTILLQGSDGVSGYGNCFGKPLITGFTRSFGMFLADRGWVESIKPVLYAGGLGIVDLMHVRKGEPEIGMLVVQFGGLGYRIGVGGGAASSMIQGDNAQELDFASVQRGAPEVERRVYCLVQSCIELGDRNPIVSLHDLGAGGSSNALPESVHPLGARVRVQDLPCGDPTLTVLEKWTNEAQERMVALVRPEDLERFQTIAVRENVPCAVVGEVTGDGRFVLYDGANHSTPVDLPLDKILGTLPRKRFTDERVTSTRVPFSFLERITVREALERVLRLLGVGSKQFLTNKVDRSVGGLVAQQQCIGPNHLPLADAAILASSFHGSSGVAHAIGERSLPGLLSPGAMARLVVAEALLNLSGARITHLGDVKGSANWMLATKVRGGLAWLYDAMLAFSEVCMQLGIAPDGGKDSLSMATKTTLAENGAAVTVPSLPTLVFGVYAPMEDVERHVTSDFKHAGHTLLFVDLSCGKDRLGASALGQVYGELGDACPDLDDPLLLQRTFFVLQELVCTRAIVSLHDKSDGGLIVTLLEMAFAGNLGMNVSLRSESMALAHLFNEEPGVVIECRPHRLPEILRLFRQRHVPVAIIGDVVEVTKGIRVRHNGVMILEEPMQDLRAIWQATSNALERRQAHPACVDQEILASRSVTAPPYEATFPPFQAARRVGRLKHKVAIIREQGTNGDREMAAAFDLAGFECWDVIMQDIVEERISLDAFRGLAFAGGFSFADVFGAGKGQAGVIRFHEATRRALEDFRARPDTFSLGICNGCQLMALMGWVPGFSLPDEQQPRFIANRSGRFESRFSLLGIAKSPAILLRGMAGARLGCWVAHGEGRLHVPSRSVFDRIIAAGLAPISYLDLEGRPTEAYPYNPNGSPRGIAALCSPDGRHLAMMPHPERTFQMRQHPWVPPAWRLRQSSPWMRLFANARQWCDRVKS